MEVLHRLQDPLRCRARPQLSLVGRLSHHHVLVNSQDQSPYREHTCDEVWESPLASCPTVLPSHPELRCSYFMNEGHSGLQLQSVVESIPVSTNVQSGAIHHRSTSLRYPSASGPSTHAALRLPPPEEPKRVSTNAAQTADK